MGSLLMICRISSLRASPQSARQARARMESACDNGVLIRINERSTLMPLLARTQFHNLCWTSSAFTEWLRLPFVCKNIKQRPAVGLNGMVV